MVFNKLIAMASRAARQGFNHEDKAAKFLSETKMMKVLAKKSHELVSAAAPIVQEASAQFKDDITSEWNEIKKMKYEAEEEARLKAERERRGE